MSVIGVRRYFPAQEADRLQVHIKYRDDSDFGDGSEGNPYNGRVNFDKCMRSLAGEEYRDELGIVRPMDVYIHRGSYETAGRYNAYISGAPPWAGHITYPDLDAVGFYHLPNMRVYGVGKVTVTLTAWPTFPSGFPWPHPHVVWGADQGELSIGGDNCLVRGIDIDCNAPSLKSSGAMPNYAKVLAILLSGDDCEIDECSYERASGSLFHTLPVSSWVTGSPGVCVIPDHGLRSGDLVSFSGVKMEGGGAGTGDDPNHSQLNNHSAAVLRIDDDSFSLVDGIGNNPFSITIPATVPGTVLFGGSESFVVGIFALNPPNSATSGYPSIARAVQGGRITRNKALSFSGDYGVPFAIFSNSAADETGGGGVIRDNEIVAHPLITCCIQVIGTGHEITYNRTNGAACLVHLDTGLIDGLLIGYNTVRDSASSAVRLHPAFPGAAQKNIRILGNDFDNSYVGPEESPVISIYHINTNSPQPPFVSNAVISGNRIRASGTSLFSVGVRLQGVDGCTVTGNIVDSHLGVSIHENCTGIKTHGNFTPEGETAQGLEDTRMAAAMQLTGNHTTSATPYIATHMGFDAVKYNYSRQPEICDLTTGEFVIPETGTYRVGFCCFCTEATYSFQIMKGAQIWQTIAQDIVIGGGLRGFASIGGSEMSYFAGDRIKLRVYCTTPSQTIYGSGATAPGAFFYIAKV